MSNLAGQMTPEAVENNLQSVLQTTDSLLDQFQALHLSLTALAVGGFVCALVLVFALREAASWFSKADGIRCELKRLQKTSIEVETEVKAIKELLLQLQSQMQIALRTQTQSSSTPGDGAVRTNANLQDDKTVAADPDADSGKHGKSEPLEREIHRNRVFNPGRSETESSTPQQFPIVH